jgi:protein tyrosine/serine phosphatase
MYQEFLSRRFLRAVTFAACLASLAAVASAQVAGVHNFLKVNDQVYRGAQPSDLGFKNLAGLGVKTVIDLREIGEHSQTEEESWVKLDGMHYISIPMKGLSAPTDSEVTKVLAIMNDSTAWPVFIHCRRGSDRTGTVVACYRISHDHWQNRKALHEARQMGMSFLERAMQSYVMRYKDEPSLESGVATTAAPRQ